MSKEHQKSDQEEVESVDKDAKQLKEKKEECSSKKDCKILLRADTVPSKITADSVIPSILRESMPDISKVSVVAERKEKMYKN